MVSPGTYLPVHSLKTLRWYKPSELLVTRRFGFLEFRSAGSSRAGTRFRRL